MGNTEDEVTFQNARLFIFLSVRDLLYELVLFKAQLGEPFLEILTFFHVLHLFSKKTGT